MIPNRYHFVFGLERQAEPFHLMYYLCLASCIQVNRPEAVYLYYHHEPYGRYWDLIKDQLILVPIRRVDFVQKYSYRDRDPRPFRYAHESDFVRLEKLVAHGGIYADMDTIFVNPVPQALFEKAFVLGREGDTIGGADGQPRPSLCNAFIMSERKASFGSIWLEKMQDAFDGSWNNHSTLYALAEQHPDLIHVEPSRTFYKHMRTPDGLGTLLERCDPDYDGVVSMHLWSHSRASRGRSDSSAFRAGLLTENHIRDVDTTYNLVARRFLPPPDTHPKPRALGISRIGARLKRGARQLRRLRKDAYVLAKIAAFSVLPGRIFPNAGVHLDYARRQWQHRYVRGRIHPRSDFERAAIVESITMWDEYGMGGQALAPSDIVVDIGAHVGTFTLLCHHLGSRSIYAYEPERDNFRLLAEHLRGLNGVNLYHLGVFRSDGRRNSILALSGYLGENTGAGTVLLGGQAWDIHRQLQVAGRAEDRQAVQAVSLDEILEDLGEVKCLKMDCEGSEFPILLTSRNLSRVQRITGEFHELTPDMYKVLDPVAKVDGFTEYRVEHLVTRLEEVGFMVTTRQTGPYLGRFDAVRPPAVFLQDGPAPPERGRAHSDRL